MSARSDLRSSALVSALALGVLADAIVRVDGRPGLNVALWAIAGVAVLVMLVRRRGEPASRETRWLILGALLFALALMLRDAEALAVFSLLSAVVLLGLAAGRATSAWAARAHVSDIVIAAVRHVLLCAAGPIGWGRGAHDAASAGARWKRQLRTVVRGTIMALPPLIVLTALLMSADEVFARVVYDTFQLDFERLLEHLLFTAVIAWLTAGYLRAFLIDDDAVTDRLRLPQPALAAAEVSVALWILNILFLVFMIVQLRCLFGGAGLVEVTAGLSYAEYARSGFFELVLTTALVVPILLVADWAAAPERPRAHAVLRGTMLLLVVLLFGVIASAAYRMWLYQNAYGLTESRLYVSVIIVWLTSVLIWLMLTVLRGHRDRFAFGSIIAGLACIAALHLLNPHAMIARVNLDRAAAGAKYDGNYLGTLSADAVPAMLARLDELPEAERCRVSNMLAKRWNEKRPRDWRTWNLSEWRARRLVAPRAAALACPDADLAPAAPPRPVPNSTTPAAPAAARRNFAFDLGVGARCARPIPGRHRRSSGERSSPLHPVHAQDYNDVVA